MDQDEGSAPPVTCSHKEAIHSAIAALESDDEVDDEEERTDTTPGVAATPVLPPDVAEMAAWLEGTTIDRRGGGESDVPVASLDELVAAAQPPSANTPTTTARQRSTAAVVENQVYAIKRFVFNGQPVGVITQNENGPCPLIAVCNSLILLGRMSLSLDAQHVTYETLASMLGEILILGATGDDPNHAQNMNDCISVFPKLQTGLDVNVQFAGCDKFEYTSELIIFDMLSLHLYHGWTVDPQETETHRVVAPHSYNTLVSWAIGRQDDDDSEETRDALRAREWLNETASQLTVHGLCELQRKAGTQEVFVLFRNNHFNTVVKRTDTDALLVLATDQGLVDQPVCWETLAGVDGDSQFLTADYARVNPDAIRTSAARPGEGVQANADYMLALELQREEERRMAQPRQRQNNTATPAPTANSNPNPSPNPIPSPHATGRDEPQGGVDRGHAPPVVPRMGADADHALAMRLQQEEQERFQQLEMRRQERHRQEMAARALAQLQAEADASAGGGGDGGGGGGDMTGAQAQLVRSAMGDGVGGEDEAPPPPYHASPSSSQAPKDKGGCAIQ